MLFPKPRPASARDILPWWHPWALMRNAWNMFFSMLLGFLVGGFVVEILAQIVARIGGGDWRAEAAWKDWLGLAIGCFVAVVSYMSYRMDEKKD